jgi:hypothetical protein
MAMPVAGSLLCPLERTRHRQTGNARRLLDQPQLTEADINELEKKLREKE